MLPVVQNKVTNKEGCVFWYTKALPVVGLKFSWLFCLGYSWLALLRLIGGHGYCRPTRDNWKAQGPRWINRDIYFLLDTFLLHIKLKEINQT
jgi:hypothetical protein